jgi:ribosomal protein S1
MYVPISEFPRVEQPLTAVQPGASVQVRVLRIDVQRRRISLSLRGQAPQQSLQVDSTGC